MKLLLPSLVITSVIVLSESKPSAYRIIPTNVWRDGGRSRVLSLSELTQKLRRRTSNGRKQKQFNTVARNKRIFSRKRTPHNLDDPVDKRRSARRKQTRQEPPPADTAPAVPRGTKLTLAEAAYEAGIRNRGIVIVPQIKPKSKPKSPVPRKLSLKAVKALQSLPNDKLARIIKSYARGRDNLSVNIDDDTIAVFKEMDPEELREIINSGKSASLFSTQGGSVPTSGRKNPLIEQCPPGYLLAPVWDARGFVQTYTCSPPQFQPFGPARSFGTGFPSVRGVPAGNRPTPANRGSSLGGVTDGQIRLLQGLSPKLIVRMVKKFSGRDITIAEAEKIKVTPAARLRELWAKEQGTAVAQPRTTNNAQQSLRLNGQSPGGLPFLVAPAPSLWGNQHSLGQMFNRVAFTNEQSQQISAYKNKLQQPFFSS